MRKLIIIAVVVACLALLISCQMPDEIVGPTDQGSEEMEVDAALEEIEQLEQEFDDDLGLDELENLDFE
jgi:hypothetical protein